MPNHVMVQFRLPHGQSTLADAAKRLGIKISDLDAGYGVVPTDPADRLFVAMVEAGAASTAAAHLGPATGAAADPAEGVFANPPIAPFGPPES